MKPPGYGLLRFGLGLGISVSLASACIVVVALLANAEDILRAYPSPEKHDDVRQIWRADPREESDARPGCLVGTGDFDGDGLDDAISVEYFHMEPLFRPSTSGMVFVRSGRDGKPLLAQATPTPFTHVSWLGDVDSNGTDDIETDDGKSRITFGFVRDR